MAKVQNPAIPQGSWVLVTGISGFIASHLADKLLEAGYKVRGTTRDVKKSSWLTDLFDEKYGKGNFELFPVDDMAAEGAFDEAVKGVAGIVHVASVMLLETDPNKVIPPTVAAALGVLKSGAKEPSVKRFVYTSSTTAVTGAMIDQETRVDENTWNEESVKVAWSNTPDVLSVYCASKTQAEQAVWKWVKEKENTDIVVNAVLPNFTFGKPLSSQKQGYLSSSGYIAAAFQGNLEPMMMIGAQHFVDVQDAALAHVAALLRPDVKNQRIFAFAAPFNINDILAVFRKLFPDRKFPDDAPNQGKDLRKMPNDKAEQLLKDMGRPGWIYMEDSLKMNVEDLV